MNKFKFYFIVFIAGLSLFSCAKDDRELTIIPPVDFAVQYPVDIAVIKDYLTTHYIDVTNPKFADNDVIIKKIDAGQPSIMSYLNASTYPKLMVRNVKIHNVDGGYDIYYLVLRPGVGVSPCNVDGVLTSYRGTYLNRTIATATAASEVTATFFEELKYPQTTFSLTSLIRGWSEIFPQFKTGNAVINRNGTVTNTDFGSGVMFIPSGLAYYNSGSNQIPSYAPLVFSFKLYAIERLDQDSDGIPSYLEDLNTIVGDGNKDLYIYDYRNTFSYPTAPEDKIRYADDTDRDGVPDFLDVDDDGDNYTTKLETKRPDLLLNGISSSNGYYPFDGAKDPDGKPSDDLSTLNVNEGEGIPSYDKASKTFDYTTQGRLRVHLDKNYPIK